MKQSWKEKLRVIATDVLAMLLGFRDPRVPRSAKIIILSSFVYLVFPNDLLPDAVPVLGWLDDAAALPLAAFLASKFMPFAILMNLRRQADARITLWGRKAVWLGTLFLVIWLTLAALGGWFARRHRHANGAPDRYENLKSLEAVR